MAENGFGNCTNHYECQAACPKGIDVKFIARPNLEFPRAIVLEKVGALAALQGGPREGRKDRQYHDGAGAKASLPRFALRPFRDGRDSSSLAPSRPSG